MLLEATHNPIRFHFADGETVRLEPGCPVDLPNPRAQKVLDKAGVKVRVVSSPSDVVIDPADPSARPVCWESMDGCLYGPATPECLVRVGGRETVTFWVVVTYQGLTRWVRSDRLRSCQAVEAQPRRERP